MMSYVSTALLASSMLFSLLVIPTREKAVSIKGTLTAQEAGDYTVTVQLDIKKGWHAYDEVGEGSEVCTSLKLKLPKGVTAKGDWLRPRGIEGRELNSQIYVGKVSFSKSVVIEPNAYGKSIDVIVSFQACTDEFCNPPQSKTVSISIPADDPVGRSIFEQPIRLNVGTAPLNAVAKKRFLAPAIFDVDRDGTTELVIGALMGSVGVYENQNTSGKGDPVWGSRQALKDAKGQPIRTSNW